MKTKRLTALLISVLMILQMFAVTVNAGQYDDVFADFSFTEFANYEDTLDETLLRAFTVDPNGKYYYGGFLNTGGIPTVYQFDASTGNEISTYQFDPEEDPGAYIKALAADDRGYVYMGVANAANDGAVYFAICSQDGLNEIKWVKIEIEGKVGVNGAAVRQFGDKYYLYIVTNYDTDRLYCYDVTDVQNPVLNTDFGSNAVGYIDLYSAFDMTDANNIAVDEAGFLYICANTGNGSKGDTVFKVALEDMSIVAQASISECFGITLLDNGYLAVCTYESTDSKVYILNQQDLTTVKVVSYENASNFTQLGVIGNQIYMSGQNPDAVFVSTAMPWGTCGENVTWTLVDGVLTISGTGDMNSMGEKGGPSAPWYQYTNDIHKLVIEDGITSIGEYAFYGLNQIREVNIPSSVKEIDYAAFWHCQLEDLTIPSGVISLNENAFNCPTLQTVYISDTVQTINPRAFGVNNTYFTIDENNTYYTAEKNIIFNKDKTTIYCCTSTEEGDFYVADSVTTIDSMAFSECRFNTVYLSQNIDRIEVAAFMKCPNLNSIYFTGNAPKITAVNAFNTGSELAIYWNEGTSGWTIPQWKAPDGNVYNTVMLDSDGNPVDPYTGKTPLYHGNIVRADTITVDGTKDDAYANVTPITVKYEGGQAVADLTDGTSNVYLATNNGLMYVYAEINDTEIVIPTEDQQKNSPWATDSLEMFIHADQIYQFRVDNSGYPSFYMNQNGDISAYGPDAVKDYFVSYAKGAKDGGYTVEFCIDLKNFGVSSGTDLGINFQLNDRANDGSQRTIYNGVSGSWDAHLYDTITVGAGESYESVTKPSVPAPEEPTPETPTTAIGIPFVEAGVITTDAQKDAAYDNAVAFDIATPLGGASGSASAKAYMMSNNGLMYLYVDVIDPEVNNPSPEMQEREPWNTDSIEFLFQTHNDAFDDVHQFRVDVSGYASYFMNESGEVQGYGEAANTYFEDYAVCKTDTGYAVEMCIDMKQFGVSANETIGIQMQLNDVLNANPTAVGAFYHLYGTEHAFNTGYYTTVYVGSGEDYDTTREPDIEVKPEVPSTGLGSRQNKNVVYATPEIDGVLSEGEWSSISSHVINADNAVAWAGETISEVVFHYAWDDEGFYLAADVEDEDICLASGIEAVYNLDAVQIALDPAGLLGAAELGGGMFFSIGPMEDGALGAVYHPYGGAAEAFDYTGAYNVTDNGWQFEIMIPWTSIEILADDGYAWTHEANEVIHALFCVLDRDADSENLYMSAIDELSFSPSDYPYALRLKPAKSADSNRGNITQIDASAISVDGKMDDAAWADALVVDIDKHIVGDNDTHGMAHMLWSDDALYIYYDIHDADVVPPSEDNQKNQPWNTDSVEMFLNFANSDDVHQFRIDCSGWLSYYLNASGDVSIYGPDAKPYFGDYAVSMDADGYNIEAAINLEKWGLLVGDTIGLQLQINDVVSPDVNFTSEVIVIDSAKGAGSWDSHLYDYVVLADKDGSTTPVVPGRGLVYTSPFAVPTVDGVMDDAWQAAEWTEIDLPFDGSLDSVCAARAKVMHDKSLLYFLVEVEDATPTVGKELDLTLQDSIELHIDEDLCRRKAYCDNAVQFGLTLDGDIREGTNANGKSDMIREYVVGKNGNGYVLEFSVALQNGMPADGNKIGLEFMYNDCDENGMFLEALRWNADTANGDTPPWQGTRSFGELVIGYRTGEMLGTSIGNVPYIKPDRIVIDGQYSSVWYNALTVDIDQFAVGDKNAATRGKAYMYWTEGKWYLFVDVKDDDVAAPDPIMQANEPWRTDSVEMFFDFGHAHSDLVKQFRIDCAGYPSYYVEGDSFWAYGDDAKDYFDEYKVLRDEDGYNIEMVIDLTKWGLEPGEEIGIQLQLNDVTTAHPTEWRSCWNMHQSMGAGSWDADLYDYITLEAKPVEVEKPVEIPVTEDKETVAVKVEEAVVQGSTVTVNNVDTDALAKVFDTPAAAPDEGAGDAETKPAAPANTVTIDVSSVKSEGAAEAEKVQQVTIPAAVVDTIKTAAENNNVEDAKLAVHLTTGSIILDKTTLDVINQAAESNENTITTVSLVIDAAEDNLNETQVIALENVAEDEVVFGKLEISMEVTKTDVAAGTTESEKIHDFDGGTVQLEVPFEIPEGMNESGFTVYYLDDEGNLEAMDTQYVNGKIVWTTGHFSDYIIMYKEPPKEPIKINVGEIVSGICGQIIDKGCELYRDVSSSVTEKVCEIIDETKQYVCNIVIETGHDVYNKVKENIDSWTEDIDDSVCVIRKTVREIEYSLKFLCR